MPIPEEIKSVSRPRGTIIKEAFGRYLVIKRTSRRVPGKKTPRTVDLGTIGEIKDGKYVEIRAVPKKVQEKKKINIKTYGTIAVAHKVGKPLFQDLKSVFPAPDAEKLYGIALLRTCEPDIKNRDIKMEYETSYLSEILPNVALSENTISAFLRDIGLEYVSIQRFLVNRAKKYEGKTQIIDGTLKDNNSCENSFSEFSRKGRIKGSKDLSIVYSYDLESKEPVLVKPYSGNLLDMRAVKDFVVSFSMKNGILVMDKGFYSRENIELFKSIPSLSFVLPLQRSASKLQKHKMYQNISERINCDEKHLLAKKVKVDDHTFLYSIRDPEIAGEEESIYLKKNEDFDPEEYEKAKEQFGVISFETNTNLSIEEVYASYKSRWEIETMFKMFKEILDLDTENVHSDFSIITSEFINYLSVILAQRLKKLYKETILKIKKNKKGEVVSATTVADNYSFKQTMRYLSKIKMVRSDNQKWVVNYPTTLKYIEELANALCIGE